MTRTLALCADDYGLAPAIDHGILGLLAAGRLSALSCLVNGAAWPAAARPLRALPAAARAGVGLHLNLTEGRPLTAALAARWPVLPPLPRLIALAHLRRLPLAAIRAEWQAQLAAFEQASGQPPAHLDGHQHVHHLPQLRGLLLELLALRPGATARHTGRVLGPGYAVKRQLIAGTGGRVLGRRLQALGRAQNTALLGVYDFRGEGYRGLMQGWLAKLPARGALIFCHPGEGGAGDAIAPARARELAYLGSSAFADDLATAGVAIGRP